MVSSRLFFFFFTIPFTSVETKKDATLASAYRVFCPSFVKIVSASARWISFHAAVGLRLDKENGGGVGWGGERYSLRP